MRIKEETVDFSGEKSQVHDNWGAQLVCPECGFQNVHISEVEVVHGNSDKSGQAWEGRGDALKIHCWCEDGHTWTVRFGEHKGYVFIKAENIKNKFNPRGV